MLAEVGTMQWAAEDRKKILANTHASRGVIIARRKSEKGINKRGKEKDESEIRTNMSHTQTGKSL